MPDMRKSKKCGAESAIPSAGNGRRRKPFGVYVLLWLAIASVAWGGDYTVDSSKPTDEPAGQFQTLEELRNAVTWVNNDKITITVDEDDSLTSALAFGSNSITFTGSGTITTEIDGLRFGLLNGDKIFALSAIDGETLEFKDFTIPIGNGGVVNSTGRFAITLGAADSTGTLVFDKNSAAWGGAIGASPNSYTSVSILGGTNTFSENSSTAINDNAGGGAIYAAGFKIQGGVNTFSGNSAISTAFGAGGGAIHIWDDPTLISGGTNTFTKNTAAGDGGGAIYTGMDAAFEISGGENKFIENETTTTNGWGGGGAISSNYQTKITGGINIFEGNTSTRRGGAIYGNSTMISGGTNTFTDNSADTFGGAIDNAFNAFSITGGTNEFSENKAASGGALYVQSANITGGINTFKDNSATTAGGAIYSINNGTFIAKDGSMLFQGNNANGIANAIYMSNSGGGRTLTLAAHDGNSILFYDPVTSRADATLTVNINRDATGNTGGTVVFDGSYWRNKGASTDNNYNSAVYGYTTVHSGTVALYSGVIYGGANTDGTTFTLNDGATLETDAFGNTIKAGTITLQGGSVLVFDMTKSDASSSNLIFDSVNAVDLSGAGTDNEIEIQLANAGAVNGTYLLAKGTTGTDFTGKYEQATAPAPVNRRMGVYEVRTANGGKDLVLDVQDADESRHVVWNGTAATSTWNDTSENWYERGASANTLPFKAGDSVHFTAASGTKTVIIDSTRFVADMSVEGGVYTFENAPGFDGVGIASTTLTDLDDAKQRLSVTGSGAEANFRTNLSFDGGLLVDAGATMSLGNGNTFASGSGAIKVDNGGTLLFYGQLDDDTLSTATMIASSINIGDDAVLKASLSKAKAFYLNQGGPAIQSIVMTATTLGGLDVGAGANLEGSQAFYNYAFEKDGDNLVLIANANANANDFASFATSSNGLAAAGVFDFARSNQVLPDGELGDVILGIFGSDTGLVERGLVEASGAVLAGGTSISNIAARQFRSSIGNFLNWKWSVDDRRANVCEPSHTWQFWAEGTGAWERRRTGDADPGYKAKIHSGAVAGYRTSGDVTFGAMIGASHVNMDWSEHLGRTKGNSFAGALFAAFERNGWFASADAVWGTTDVDSHRRLPLAGLSANADYRTHWYGGDLELGYKANICDWRLTPSVGMRWYRFDSPSVREKGAGSAGLWMERDHQTSFELFASARVSRQFNLSDCVQIRPFLGAGMSMETGDRQARMRVGFLGGQLPSFSAYAPKRGRWRGKVDAGFEIGIRDNVTVSVEYNGEYGTRYRHHGGKLGIGVAF